MTNLSIPFAVPAQTVTVTLTKPQFAEVMDRVYSGSEGAAAALKAGMTLLPTPQGGQVVIPPKAARKTAAFFACYGQLAVDALTDCFISERGRYTAERNAALKVGAALGLDIMAA